MRTEFPSQHEIDRAWHVIDAEEAVLGRIASRAAMLLMGKHKPTYTPSMDTGDHVIVINAAKVKLTGNKDGQKGVSPAYRIPRRIDQHRSQEDA